MLLLDRQKVAATPGRTGSNHVQLRLRADGQLLELPMGKTTIGSSPRCNLRLQQPGVQPLHCLIVHGPEGLSVRRWAADTRLNGEAFDDAPLAEGDCLELGGVELELVPSESVVTERAKLAETTDWTSPPAVVRDDALLQSVEESVAAIESLEEAPIATETAVVEIEPAVGPLGEAESDNADTFDVSTATPSWWSEATQKLLPSPSPFVEEAQSTDTDDWAPVPAVAEREVVEGTVEEPVAEAGCWDETPIASETELVEHSATLAPRVEPEADSLDDFEPSISALDAAEVVFNELQVACATSRGRSRKLLSTLRGKRYEYNELVSRLLATERQLAELQELRTAWEKSQTDRAEEQHDLSLELQDLRRQIGELEGRLAEQTQRLNGLQQELETARLNPAPATAVSEQAINQAMEGFDIELCQPEVAEVDPNKTDAVAAVVIAPVPESITVSEEINDWASTPASDAWSTRLSALTNSGEKLETSREVRPWHEEAVSHTSPVQVEDAFATEPAEPNVADQTAWAVEAPAPATEEFANEEPVSEAINDTNPFAEFSIWKQGAKPEPAEQAEAEAPVAKPATAPTSAWGSSSFGDDDVESTPIATQDEVEPVVATSSLWSAPVESADSVVDETPPEKVKPTSYLEKYSHLFKEEEAEQEEPAVAAPIQSLASAPLNSALRKSDVLRNESNGSKSSANDDEESIEQYMAKLLQRVRGDGPASVASQAAPSSAAAVEVASTAKPMSSQRPAAILDDEQQRSREPMSEDQATEELATWDVSKRKAAAPTPASNLGALRALANETARRAISRHELVKHRRNTVTKVIVSTLAGMTGLWLMMEAPSWRDMQFVTACVLMLVAAYWAGQSLRTWFESMRAAAYDGPDAYADDSEAGQHSTLPIDVEDRF